MHQIKHNFRVEKYYAKRFLIFILALNGVQCRSVLPLSSSTERLLGKKRQQSALPQNKKMSNLDNKAYNGISVHACVLMVIDKVISFIYMCIF